MTDISWFSIGKKICHQVTSLLVIYLSIISYGDPWKTDSVCSQGHILYHVEDKLNLFCFTLQGWSRSSGWDCLEIYVGSFVRKKFLINIAIRIGELVLGVMVSLSSEVFKKSREWVVPCGTGVEIPT